MEEKNFSHILGDPVAFEERYMLWQQSYQHHQKMMENYYRQMERLNHQLAFFEQKRRNIQDMLEDLERVRQERAFRRATRP